MSYIHNVLLRSILSKNMDNIETKEKPYVSGSPVTRRRYYFYQADPAKSIKFTSLQAMLKSDSADRDATIEKLQGGNTGKYYADYFRWKKVAIVTNEYSPGGKSLMVYEADLSPIGAKIPGSEKITPSDMGITPESVETDLLLYADKRGNSGIVNLDTSSETFFINSEPPSNISKILLGRAVPGGRPFRYADFVKTFDEYRIWVPNLNQLLLPDFNVPKTDDFKGGHYVGGQRAYMQLVGPIEKELEQKKDSDGLSLGQKVKDKEVFQPVTKTTEPVKGDYIDTLSKASKMAMDKQNVHNVVLAYLKKAQSTSVSPGTMSQTQTGPGATDPIVFPLGKTVQQSNKNKQQMEKAIDLQKQQEKLVQQTRQPTTQTIKL